MSYGNSAAAAVGCMHTYDRIPSPTSVRKAMRCPTVIVVLPYLLPPRPPKAKTRKQKRKTGGSPTALCPGTTSTTPANHSPALPITLPTFTCLSIWTPAPAGQSRADLAQELTNEVTSLNLPCHTRLSGHTHLCQPEESPRPQLHTSSWLVTRRQGPWLRFGVTDASECWWCATGRALVAAPPLYTVPGMGPAGQEDVERGREGG